MNRIGERAFAWLLCLALILALAVPAFAEGAAAQPSAEQAPAEAADNAPAEAPLFEGSILDSAAISKMVDDYLTQKGIGKDRVGIGFCYTATGDEWFLNPDTWFYPGSMYKVPLMMILSERLRDGQISPDTQIGGLDLDTVYNYILVHSNNDYAHAVRKFLIDGQGGDEIWRKEAQQYARLDKYDERYLLYCYFSPRYMTQVMETLFNDPDRFPKVMDNLLQAEQGHYFRLLDEMHPYDVAQKYGSYLDNEGSDWNNTTGIIYTPNPFIITVMTKNVGGAEQIIGQLGALFKDYTLKLDDELAAYQAEQARLEAELQAAEEAERLAAEQAAAGEQPAAAAQPKQNAPAQSTPRPGQPETQLQTTTPDRAERGHRVLNPTNDGMTELSRKLLELWESKKSSIQSNEELADFIFAEDTQKDADYVKLVLIWLSRHSCLGRWSTNQKIDENPELRHLFHNADKETQQYAGECFSLFENPTWPLSLMPQHIYAEMIRLDMDDPDDELAEDIDRLKWKPFGIYQVVDADNQRVRLKDFMDDTFSVRQSDFQGNVRQLARQNTHLAGAFICLDGVWRLNGPSLWSSPSRKQQESYLERMRHGYDINHKYANASMPRPSSILPIHITTKPMLRSME